MWTRSDILALLQLLAMLMIALVHVLWKLFFPHGMHLYAPGLQDFVLISRESLSAAWLFNKTNRTRYFLRPLCHVVTPSSTIDTHFCHLNSKNYAVIPSNSIETNCRHLNSICCVNTPLRWVDKKCCRQNYMGYTITPLSSIATDCHHL
jgi:hypothetical protein